MKVSFESQGAVVGEDVQITPNGKSVGKVLKIICVAEITDKEAQGASKKASNRECSFSGISGYGVPVSGILFDKMPNGFGI